MFPTDTDSSLSLSLVAVVVVALYRLFSPISSLITILANLSTHSFIALFPHFRPSLSFRNGYRHSLVWLLRSNCE
ncbi:uncharacterized protein BDW70DRAFT_132853 [Aspergillus foveolatus]|uniref:uncharacterized protein n=1 Tax=Aspergillus foveolatus TaxID=210207 RepID=UPI003CCE1213